MKSLKRQRGFIGIGGAILGSSVIGGTLGFLGSQSAASTQADAARRGQDIQQQMFGQTQANLQPWMQAGTQSLAQLGQGLQPGGMFTHQFGLQDFQASPAYQFNLQEGQKAIDKAAAARGNLYAPQTLQDISKYSQGLASNEFQNAFQNYRSSVGDVYNRLFNISQGGQSAAAGLGTAGQAYAGNVANLGMAGAQAQAQGTLGAYGSLQDIISGGTNAYIMNQILSQNQAPSSVGYNPSFMVG